MTCSTCGGRGWVPEPCRLQDGEVLRRCMACKDKPLHDPWPYRLADQLAHSTEADSDALTGTQGL